MKHSDDEDDDGEDEDDEEEDVQQEGSANVKLETLAAITATCQLFSQVGRGTALCRWTQDKSAPYCRPQLPPPPPPPPLPPPQAPPMVVVVAAATAAAVGSRAT